MNEACNRRDEYPLVFETMIKGDLLVEEGHVERDLGSKTARH